jgi:hypothetical protein
MTDKTDAWTILSAEWEGDTRLEAHRRRLTQGMREDTVEILLGRLAAVLGIDYLASMKEFYLGT